MRDSIKNFSKQFEYIPTIENADKLIVKNRVIVAGMGGSELSAMIMKDLYPEIDFILHRNYGLPRLGDEKLKDSLVIASSYSGNTEETIDAFNTAIQNDIPVAVIATGGKLLELAIQRAVPYIQMPNTGIQPRTALGYSTLSLLKIVGKDSVVQEIKTMSSILNPSGYEEQGKQWAKKLHNKIPIIYSSKRNAALTYVWKIKFNETGKIPAFCNTFPELNHNEMTGFSAGGGSAFGGDVNVEIQHIIEHFACILIRDSEDNPKITRRMDVLSNMYKERGIETHDIALEGKSRLFKIFSSIILADWISFYIAESYGVEAEQVPMVEEFKKLISNN